MKRVWILIALVICLNLALVACGGNDAPTPAAKKGDRSESDFSASGMVKEIEEMKKAGDKGKAPEQPQQVPAPATAEPKK